MDQYAFLATVAAVIFGNGLSHAFFWAISSANKAEVESREIPWLSILGGLAAPSVLLLGILMFVTEPLASLP